MQLPGFFPDQFLNKTGKVKYDYKNKRFKNYHLWIQVGLAVAQPFIINTATKVAVHWFPVNERATTVEIATLAQFTGIIIAMIATPSSYYCKCRWNI